MARFSGGLAQRVLQGDVRAASRLMRQVEDQAPDAYGELKVLYPHTGRAQVLGITGAPGVGKSTLTSRLIALLREKKKTVGVLAVDPSSPFTGGAILGDRIRMQEHSLDPDVFIRSLATRGHMGGLSRATGDCMWVMDALGRDVILVETVGVGQDELEIAHLAHSAVVVLVPGMGDDVQAIKAGILEVADVFAVNKSDLDGADRVVRELRLMLELRHAVKPRDHDAQHRPKGVARAAGPKPPDEWEPPIVKTVAGRNEGIEELWSAIEAHRKHLGDTGELAVRERKRATTHFIGLLRERLLAGALQKLEREKGRLEDVSGQLAEHRADPYTLAEELAREFA